jgi:hypothetical protein
MSESLFPKVITRLYGCTALDVAQGPYQLVDAIHRIGGGFLEFNRQHPSPDPLASARPGAEAVWLSLEHELLAKDNRSHPKRAYGSADLTLWFPSLFITLSQDITNMSDDAINTLAMQQLQVARLLWAQLKPAYGCIDERSSRMPSETDVAAQVVTTVFWANFFGPSYVKTMGLAFLDHVPGWHNETINDGDKLYVISSMFLNRSQEVRISTVRNYFRQQFPRMRVYQPRKERGEY